MIDDKKENAIEYKSRVQVIYSIIEFENEDGIFNGLSISSSDNLASLLFENDESVEIYLIENMLLINFNQDNKHYCFYSLPEFYLKDIKENKGVHILSINNDIDNHFYYEKTIG